MKPTPRSAVRRALLQGAVALAATLPFGAPALAQATDFPTKPLRFVVPYPPGGPLDTMARMLAEKVRGSLGQPVIVENRSGAGGNIGADLVAKAPADGYTLVMGAVATHAINPWLFANLPYDPVKDFAPVTIVASVPNVLVMNVEFAQKNKIEKLADLQARLLARAVTLVKPGGRIVFSNCSLDPLEGEELYREFLARTSSVAHDPVLPGEIAGLDPFLTPQGTLRSTPADMDLGSPGISGLDGFFAARMRRIH